MSAPVLTHPDAERIAARLNPFVEAGAIEPLALHTVDTLGRHAGESREEVLLALALAVQAPIRGHVCVALDRVQPHELASEDASEEAVAALTLPPDRQAWLAAIASSPLVGDGCPFQVDADAVYTTRYHRYETRLADALVHRLVEHRPAAHPELLAHGLDALFHADTTLDRQQIAAATSALRGLTVISGGPGTGKTHTVSRVLALLWAQWAASASEGVGPRVALAAPTGKAAARMSEAIANGRSLLLDQVAPGLPAGRTPGDLAHFLDTLRPTTLHRLLGFQPATPTRFRHNQNHPLPHDIVIVDEASMVDVALMAKLIDAIAPTARLVLLGDKNQLASVEAGTVLADIAGPVTPEPFTLSAPLVTALREVGLPLPGVHTTAPTPRDGIALLTHSRRFTEDSGIGHFARACLVGASGPDAAQVLDQWPDLMHVAPTPTGQLPPAALGAVLDALVPAVQALLAGPSRDQTLSEHHLAVLKAYESFRVLAAHRRGRLGVSGLNDTIARALADRVPGFSPSNRHYLGRPVLVRRNDPVVGRYNGDVGLMVMDAEGALTTVFQGESGPEYLAPARLPDHQTVFAMTIHKSQGSEFDHAMVVLPEAASPILTRELVYTGVTRAKTRLTLVADAAVLGHALGREVRRSSGLRRRLWGDA